MTIVSSPREEIGDRCNRPKSGKKDRMCGAYVWRRAQEAGFQSCYGHITWEEWKVVQASPYSYLTTVACWDWAVSDEFKQKINAPGLRDTEAKDLLRAWQRGRCAMCGQHATKLVLDHDHGTDLVRGYLCPSCNILEGHGGTHPELVCAKYRQRNPATILGLTVSYSFRYRSALISLLRARGVDLPNHASGEQIVAALAALLPPSRGVRQLEAGH